MALRWDFNLKSGTVTEKIAGKEITFNWYEGNALMIVLDEFTDDKGTDRYNMRWFFIGDEHAKNCLGLSRGHENMFDAGAITSLTIYRDNCRQWKKIADYFTKAFPDITIQVLPKAAAA